MQNFSSRSDCILQIVKGVVTAVLITLIAVLIFAFILSVSNLSDGVIKPINQFIKLISVFLACFLCAKGEKMVIKGGLIGLFSAILSVLIFALISGGGYKFYLVLIDVVFAFLMGVLSAIITSLVKKR